MSGFICVAGHALAIQDTGARDALLPVGPSNTLYRDSLGICHSRGTSSSSECSIEICKRFCDTPSN